MLRRLRIVSRYRLNGNEPEAQIMVPLSSLPAIDDLLPGLTRRFLADHGISLDVLKTQHFRKEDKGILIQVETREQSLVVFTE
jgi:hypothetical protein